MGLKGWVLTCKPIQENSNDEKNPPLFQLHVIWYVGFGLAIKIKCDLQIAPTCNVNHDTLRTICATLFRMCPCQCDVSPACLLARLGRELVHDVTVQFITLAIDSQAWLTIIIWVRTISFLGHVNAGAAHYRGLGVASGGVLAGQRVS